MSHSRAPQRHDSHAIAYAAHAGDCTFFLDAEGFCRKVSTRRRGKDAQLAQRCLDAQYVASIDVTIEGALVELPRPGAPMLFARVDDGRVSLVRSAPLERFESLNAGDEKPTETRAPKKAQSAPPPAPSRPLLQLEVPDPDTTDQYHEHADRTQPRHRMVFDLDEDDHPTLFVARRKLTSDPSVVTSAPPPPQKRGMLPRRESPPTTSPPTRRRVSR